MEMKGRKEERKGRKKRRREDREKQIGKGMER